MNEVQDTYQSRIDEVERRLAAFPAAIARGLLSQYYQLVKQGTIRKGARLQLILICSNPKRGLPPDLYEMQLRNMPGEERIRFKDAALKAWDDQQAAGRQITHCAGTEALTFITALANIDPVRPTASLNQAAAPPAPAG